jgi:HSP90 family molecular chaperone
MNSKTVQIDTLFLQKIAEFTKLALSEIHNLRATVKEQLQKEASAEQSDAQYRQAVKKVASALYNSDLDFVTGDFDHQQFIKVATADPSYLAKTFEKICNASDVSSIGRPARVAAIKKQASYDPVYARAFGSNYLLDDSIMDTDD